LQFCEFDFGLFGEISESLVEVVSEMAEDIAESNCPQEEYDNGLYPP
jgi:hypothetical protein